MIQKFKKIGLAAITLMLYIAAVTSCNKDGDGGDNSSEIPDETSTFWNDAYRQHQLNGKVKTVITRSNTGVTTDYDLLEYDANGNLIKNHRREMNNPGKYHGLTLFYDSQNRLTKVIYGSNENPEREVAEFGYDGSHTAYIPTNIYSMEDLRLQKGVSSVKYKVKDEDPMVVNCSSVSGNRAVFEGTAGWLADLLGNINKVEIECNGAYPAHISFKNMGTMHSEAKVSFGADGIPTKVTYVMQGGEEEITEYTTKGGFLLMTKQYGASDPTDCDVFTYNDKGMLTHKLESDGTQYRYAYILDSNGNWTESKEEVKYPGREWESGKTKTREFTYWN